MKKKILRVFSCVITICLTIAVLSKLTDLMERKSSDQKYADFWSQEEDFDVLFMGTSQVINAVFPMELWNDYGIVSYNFGGHSNEVATTYWVMENALEKTTPKVVVIDCLAVDNNRKCSDIFSYLHLSLDTFPANITKLRAIWDLLNDPALDEDIANGTARESDEPRTKIGLLWDYSVYHSRWNQLGKNDFEPELTYEKGAESRIAVVRGSLEKISADEKISPGSTGDIYLKKMIEDCRRRGIEVVLMYLPFPASEEKQRTANYIYDVAEEYGVDYINFLDMDIIDYQTDLYDRDYHLNPSGARKIKDYLGDYLVSNYNLTDHRKDTDYTYWDEDYDEYVCMKDSNLVTRTDIVEYLMLLSGDDLEIRMNIRNKDIFNCPWIMDLLANIGIDTEALSDQTDIIIVKNRGQEVCVYQDGQGGYSGLYLNGEEKMEGDIADDTSVQIDVYRGNKRIDSVKFVCSVDPETGDISTIAANR